MIVTSECNNCLLKDLCVNRNQTLENIEGHEWFYVTLICKHKHINKIVERFDCDKCKNKPICKVHNEKLVSADAILIGRRNEIKDAMNKLPHPDAFDAVLCCKGYMTE